MSLFGQRVLRREDPKLLTRGGTYVADLRDERLAGAATVVYVRSTVAHGRITSIDTSEAAAAPGVLAVVTAADLGLPPAPPLPFLPPEMARPLLADGTVRFVGEPVVAVVAEDEYLARDAAELVVVDYEPLPAVVGLDDALAGETLLFPEAGTNVALVNGPAAVDDLWAGCEVVTEPLTITHTRLAAVPLEARASAAAWVDGRLVQWASTQAPHLVKAALVAVHGLDESDVLVLVPDVGGGFGAKIVYPEELLLGVLAGRVGRPVRWVDTRTEAFQAMTAGRGQRATVQVGGTRDGRILAYRMDVLADAGAYPELGAWLPTMTALLAPGVYDIPKVQVATTSVVTNTAPTAPYRGAGRPEATVSIERAVDAFAAEIGMDPVEVRRRNLLPPDAFPHVTATGARYDSGDYRRVLDLVLEAAGYDDLRAEQSRRRAAGDALQLGIGVSTYVEITGQPEPPEEASTVTIDADGDVTATTGTSPHGQGHVTAWSMLVADALGVPMERVTIVHGDTDAVPTGMGTYASRSLQIGGSAVHAAATRLADDARKLAADLLEASADDVVLDRASGRFHVAGTPARSVGWRDVVAHSGERRLTGHGEFRTEPTFPFGAHLAVVEVDTETGGTRLVRMVTVDDAGRILNPLLAEGQRHGGIAQGVAQALYEEMRFDDEGTPLTATLADYAVPTAAELPTFELHSTETPSPNNPLGVKGIGESGTIGATPAVLNAVVDALSPFGVRHVPMPATPERVWRAVEEARTRTPAPTTTGTAPEPAAVPPAHGGSRP
jgi:aerobic carbon-monoxide dehydrogenase large subunit